MHIYNIYIYIFDTKEHVRIYVYVHIFIKDVSYVEK